jgi:hypothetical protein
MRDRWTAKLRAWTALIRWTADIVSSQWVSSRSYKFNAGKEKFTATQVDRSAEQFQKRRGLSLCPISSLA